MNRRPFYSLVRLITFNPMFSLGLLLLTLFCSIFFSPLLIDNTSLGGTLFSCLVAGNLILILSSLTENNRRIRLWLQITGSAIVALRVFTELFQSIQWLSFFTLITSLLFHLVMMLILMRHLFSTKPQTEKLLTAINFYLLTGITFSYLYLLVNLMHPGAFDLGNQNISSWPDYLYFSFVTLTTLGYGDILPMNRIAQSLVVLESVIGVLSPTVMIARFVSK